MAKRTRTTLGTTLALNGSPNGQAPSSPPGQQTKSQRVIGLYQARSSIIGLCPVQPGDYGTYRRMMNNPTIALARAVVFAICRSVNLSWESDDDAEGMAEVVSDCLDPIRDKFIAEVLRSLDFGWMPFEKVWGVNEGRKVITALRALLPDITDVAEQPNGELWLKNTGVDLPPGKHFRYAYDAEADNPFGRSRLENIRANAWRAWTDTLEKFGQYTTKGASVVPVVEYPLGSGVDASGAAVDNYDIAVATIDRLAAAKGVAFPKEVDQWAQKMIDNGTDPKEIMAWKISFLESRAGHGEEFVNSLGYFDKLMCRGYLMPERAILEGQFGTKAEAGAHGDMGIQVCEFTMKDIIAEVNRQVVDDILEENFGPEARGKVRWKVGPLQSDDKAYARSLLQALWSSAPDLMLEQVDINGLMDQSGTPKLREIVVNPPMAPDPKSLPAGSPDAAQLSLHIERMRRMGLGAFAPAR